MCGYHYHDIVEQNKKAQQACNIVLHHEPPVLPEQYDSDDDTDEIDDVHVW